MTRLLLTALVLLLIPAGLVAAPVGLEDYQAIYQREIKKIDAKYSDTSQADRAYVKALEEARVTAIQKVDVTTAKAIVEEQKRFKDFKDLTSETPSELPEAIKKAQEAYALAAGKVRSYRNLKVVELSQKYVASLKGLAAGFLKQNKFNDAEKVTAEIKKVEFVIADLSSNLPVATSPSKPRNHTTRPSATKPAAPDRPVGFPAALKKGLILWYGFDKNEAEKVTDKSGKGNDGEVVDGRWHGLSEGQEGVMEFASALGRINVTPFKLGSEWSFSVMSDFPLERVKLTILIGSLNWNHIVVKRGVLGFEGGAGASSGFNVEELRGWHHLTAIGSAGRTAFYVDGKEVGVAPQNDMGLVKVIGNHKGPTQNAWGAKFDEVMIWDRALSEDEIKQLHKLMGGK